MDQSQGSPAEFSFPFIPFCQDRASSAKCEHPDESGLRMLLSLLIQIPKAPEWVRRKVSMAARGASVALISHRANPDLAGLKG